MTVLDRENSLSSLGLGSPPNPNNSGGGGESDIGRLWQLITELNDQLNENRALAVGLYAQASNTKVRSVLSPCLVEGKAC